MLQAFFISRFCSFCSAALLSAQHSLVCRLWQKSSFLRSVSCVFKAAHVHLSFYFTETDLCAFCSVQCSFLEILQPLSSWLSALFCALSMTSHRSHALLIPYNTTASEPRFFPFTVLKVRILSARIDPSALTSSTLEHVHTQSSAFLLRRNSSCSLCAYGRWGNFRGFYVSISSWRLI